jgi:hypothetical protein
MYENYEGYTNTATAFKSLLASLYDWQVRDFLSSDVRFKKCLFIKSHLVLLVKCATHIYFRWRRGTICTFQLGLIVILM